MPDLSQSTARDRALSDLGNLTGAERFALLDDDTQIDFHEAFMESDAASDERREAIFALIEGGDVQKHRDNLKLHWGTFCTCRTLREKYRAEIERNAGLS